MVNRGRAKAAAVTLNLHFNFQPKIYGAQSAEHFRIGFRASEVYGEGQRVTPRIRPLVRCHARGGFGLFVLLPGEDPDGYLSRGLPQ